MPYLIGIVAVGLALALVFGAVSGRVKVRSCCPADPSLDRRMQLPVTDQDATDQQSMPNQSV